MEDQLVFKIQRVSDGKFQQGGSAGKFTEIGKIWVGAGHIKNHMLLGKRFGDTNEDLLRQFAGTKIVVFKLVEYERMSPKEFFDKRK